MSERCDICGAGNAEHSCYRCERTVCSSCIDENGLLCKNCRINDVEGIHVGFAPLKKMVNLPLFAMGIAILITGIVIMTWASLAFTNVEQIPQQQQPRGFIYIFPFIFGWGSPDVGIILPVMIAMIVLPIITMLFIFRNFTRS